MQKERRHSGQMTGLLSHPKQARAREAFDRIVTQATLAIVRGGVPALSTSEVAQAAEVNISTLYKYFRSKEDIVRHIALKIAAQQDERMTRCIEAFPSNARWQDVLTALVDVMEQSWSEIEGFQQIQRYYVMDPVLRASYRKSSLTVASQLRRFKEVWRFKGSEKDWTRLHLVFGECATSILDLAASEVGNERKKIVEQLKVLAISYHTPYLS
jgi:AcrR family transcriptional regulator